MRVAVVVLGAVAVLAACSGGSSGNVTAPTVPAGSADPSGWSKQSVAAVHTIADKLAKTIPGGCTNYKVADRTGYIHGLKRVGPPVPDAVGECTALTEDLEISMFPSSSVRDKFVSNRRDKLCAISAKNKINLPGLYWVVGNNWSIQPDSEGVSRRVAQVLHAQYEATGCTNTNPGWDPTSVSTLEQTGSKLQSNKLGCADLQMQDRDLVSRTVPYVTLGTPAAQANCTLSDGSTIVLSAYNTPADKTDQLIHGELGRECVQGPTFIVRVGNVAVYVGQPTLANKVKNALGGTLSPLSCKIFATK